MFFYYKSCVHKKKFIIVKSIYLSIRSESKTCRYLKKLFNQPKNWIERHTHMCLVDLYSQYILIICYYIGTNIISNFQNVKQFIIIIGTIIMLSVELYIRYEWTGVILVMFYNNKLLLQWLVCFRVSPNNITFFSYSS